MKKISWRSNLIQIKLHSLTKGFRSVFQGDNKYYPQVDVTVDLRV